MKQFTNPEGTVLVTVFDADTMTVATRPDSSYSFGPHIVVRPIQVTA